MSHFQGIFECKKKGLLTSGKKLVLSGDFYGTEDETLRCDDVCVCVTFVFGESIKNVKTFFTKNLGHRRILRDEKVVMEILTFINN